MGDPDPDLVGFVDQGLLRHGGRGVIALGIDRDGGEHLRLQHAFPIVDGGANQQPAGRRIDRGRHVGDARGQRMAGQRHDIDRDFLPYRHDRGVALANERNEPDGGEIADHKDRIAGAGVDILAGADLALHDRARDRRVDRDLRIDGALALKGRDGLVGEA